MAFIDDIGYYAGSTSGKNTEVSKFLANGVQYIISVIEKSNPDMLPLFASAQTLNNSATTLSLATNSKIIDVVRKTGSNGEDLKCSPINSAFRSNAANVDSIYFASKNSPVYYISNAVLHVLPIPTAAETAAISIVLPDTSVAHSDSAIDNFPSQLYHGVVLYAAGQLIHNKMTAFNAKLPTDLDADTTAFDAIADIGLSLSLIGLPSFANASKSLPGTISIASDLPANWTSGLSTAMPTFNLNGVSISGEYADAILMAKDLIDIGIVTDEDSGASDDATPQSAGYWLKEEDPEMVSANLATAAQELQRASIHLQNYQNDVNVRAKSFENEMATFQAKISEEQAELTAAAQKVSTELSVDSTIASTDVAIYQAEMTREQTRYNAEVTKYQADVQGKMQSLNYELQEWNANLQKKISLYTTLIGKLSTDYQWLQGQYQVVKSEFAEFMAPFTTGGVLDSTAEGVRR